MTGACQGARPAGPPGRAAIAEALLALACAAATTYPILAYGDVQFGGADGGVVANAAWLGHLGYKPYVDFRTAAPPAYLIGARLAYDVFGVRWHSLVLAAAAYSAATFLFQYALLRRLPMAPGWRLLAATATQAATMTEIGWWYYNHIAAVAAALAVTAALVLLVGRPDRRAYAYWGLSAALLMLMKPNVAGFTLVATLPLLLLRPALRAGVLAALLGAGLLDLLVLAAFDIDPRDVLASYLAASGRASDPGNALRFLLVVPEESGRVLLAALPALGVLLLVLGGAAAARDWARAHWPLAAAGVAGLLISLVAMLTNNEHKLVEVPAFLVGVIALVGCAGELPVAPALRTSARAAVAVTAVLLTALGFEMAHSRFRVFTTGPEKYFQLAPLTVLEAPPYFRGFHASPRLCGTLRDMAATLGRYRCAGRPDAPVYFGLRVDFGFPAFGIREAKGLPLWWAGTGEVPAPEVARQVEQFKRADFKLCIFLKDDYTYAPPELLAYLNDPDRFEVRQTEYLTVHVARGWDGCPPEGAGE